MNYKLNVPWDVNVVDIWFLDTTGNMPVALQGLAYEGKYIVTGAPAATAGYWCPGAKIYNIVDATWYINTGTTASPVWATIPTSASAFSLPTAETDSTTTTGVSLAFTQNTITSGTGFAQALNGLTTGKGHSITHTTAVIANGGSLQNISSTSIDTSTTTGVLQNLSSTASLAGTQTLHTYSALTTGIGDSLVVAALTTGIGNKVTAAAATLTTGRYYSANDGALEVFGIGANGHIHTAQTTAPTAATNATGISAVAVTAGSTDVAGTITTTGTPASGTVLTITFNKTYTTAPKFVTVEAANAAAGGVNTPPIVTQTATTLVLTWPAGGTYAATPSFTYFVVA